MTDYEKAVAIWQKKNISTDAELAEAGSQGLFCRFRSVGR